MVKEVSFIVDVPSLDPIEVEEDMEVLCSWIRLVSGVVHGNILTGKSLWISDLIFNSVLESCLQTEGYQFTVGL
jgi:hypothetical protein